ncbi:glycosyltransferase family 9 protein [Spirosoma daeguense]
MITTTTSPRFLIIQTAFIGDVILATALLEQFHAAWPEATLDVLVRKGNEGLLANHPFLNDVLIWHKKGTKYRDLWRLLRIVRSRKYDAVLNLQRFGTMGLLTTLSGAGQTIGFSKNPFSRFFTHQVEHRFEPGVHEVDRNFALLKALDANRAASVSATLARPKLYPSGADYEAVKSYQQQRYICMAPMSVWFTKQYPPERWVELIQALPENLTIYLLGAPTDTTDCEKIRQATGRSERVVNLAGKLSLLQSAALQQEATMNYVNDSAPLHLCSAMNAPTTAIFCSTVPEFGFGPLADVSRVVQTPEKLDCKPCNLHGKTACPLGHFRCALDIRVEELAKLDF